MYKATLIASSCEILSNSLTLSSIIDISNKSHKSFGLVGPQYTQMVANKTRSSGDERNKAASSKQRIHPASFATKF